MLVQLNLFLEIAFTFIHLEDGNIKQFMPKSLLILNYLYSTSNITIVLMYCIC